MSTVQASPLFLPIKPFDGDMNRFRRWEESVLLRLRTLDIAYVLFDPRPDADPDAAFEWDRDDALCRGHILHTLSDRLFDVHVHRRTAKSLWDALHMIYEADNSIVTGRSAYYQFVSYEIDPHRSVLEQLAELQSIASRVDHLGEDMFVATVVDKLWPLPMFLNTGNVGLVRDMSMEALWREVRRAESLKNYMKECGEEVVM